MAALRRGEQMLLSWAEQLLTQEAIGSAAVTSLTFTLTLNDPAATADIDDCELFDRALSPDELAEAANFLSIPVASKYYYLNGQRVAKAVDGEVTWIHSDHLHSATILTDAAGNEIRRLAYRAFGEELENTGSGAEPKYSYTGKELDNSGLMYYGARYYDPALSRFITPDTIYDRGPQGLNRYSYCSNNPIIYRDPTGHYKIYGWTQESVENVIKANEAIREHVDFIPDFLLDMFLPVTPAGVNGLVADMAVGMGSNLITGPGKKVTEEVVEEVADYGKKVLKEALEEGGDEMLEHGKKIAKETLDEGTERASRDILGKAPNPKSRKQFGHTFETHGAGTKNTRKLQGRAGGTGDNQGQWLNNQKAADFLSQYADDITTPQVVDIPEGMGQVIKPDGSIVPANKAQLVPKPGGGYRSAYPIE